MVLLLVILFTGLGLMAMRHTTADLRASGAHLDKTQAGMIGEAGLTMLATDMRLYWDKACAGDLNYPGQFRRELMNLDPEDFSATMKLKFSPFMDGGNDDCPTPAGEVPNINPAVNFQDTPTLQSTATASLQLAQRMPVCAPCDPGDSGGATFSWYYFTAESVATYGAIEPPELQNSEESQIVRGRATARSRMRIGPLSNFLNCPPCDE